MLKRMSLVSKRAGMSDNDFVDHWRKKHSVLVKQLSGLLAYRQTLVIGAVPLLAKPYQLDGFAELWFSDAQSMKAAMSSPAGKALPGDEREFLRAVTSFATNATNPQGSPNSHYVICSPTSNVTREINVFERLIRQVPDIIDLEHNIVEGIIRRPRTPFPMQDVGFFAGVRFKGHANPNDRLAGPGGAEFRAYLESAYQTVSLVEVEQYRVV